jgi:ABC-type antimicrobial peptide transport system permease subunit
MTRGRLLAVAIVAALLIPTASASNAVGVGAVVTPGVTPKTIAEALLIGIAIGVVAGLYPAWRAVRMPASRLLGG